VPPETIVERRPACAIDWRPPIELLRFDRPPPRVDWRPTPIFAGASDARGAIELRAFRVFPETGARDLRILSCARESCQLCAQGAAARSVSLGGPRSRDCAGDRAGSAEFPHCGGCPRRWALLTRTTAGGEKREMQEGRQHPHTRACYALRRRRRAAMRPHLLQKRRHAR
jgi:hypothetical protein